ncbi:hypothetical protein MSAN_01639200 [Mycena sanguinolenta]|uniref:Uncharacterized protein n=1 Tax=Mycena sanguinolenta TaxID=230812 RepID=A0A8H6Y2Y7_9AGAR|nr:hypothetical protein MSAN_01639200 [Mycena sanguinolenta]
MGSAPSILEKTPQEHAEAAAQYLEKQREVAIWPPQPIVPAGYVRVQFYGYRYKVRDGLRPDMETVLPLEKNGDLSLFAVRRLWGLESSSIIDPLELKIGFTADPNWLSAGAVKELVAKHGCIKVIEPYASYETLIKRQLRHVALAGISALNSWSVLALAGVRDDSRTMFRLVKHLSGPYSIGKSRVVIDWARAANLVIFLAVLFCLFTGKNICLPLLRLGDAVVNLVAASSGLTLGFWACLATIFFAAPEAYTKTLEMTDEKVLFVLSG